jgi:hypothetical protein
MSAEQTWEELRIQRERPIFRRVNDVHPFDIYLGIDAHDAPLLMLLSSQSVGQLPQLRALEVSQNVRHDGKIALLVTLASSDLLYPFRYVCDDLIESLRTYTNTGSEALFLLHRLEKWRRLLEASKRGLSHAELVGLIGELLFLERLIHSIGPVAAVDAWLGPSGAPQDFQNGGRIYEIKSCAIGGHTVVISSLEQLHTGTTPTSLIVYGIGSCGADSSGAFTLNQLLTRIRQVLESTTATSTFELKLGEVGYDEKQPEAESPFVVQKIRAFDVRNTFPRLTPTTVSPAVTSATYGLDLDHCGEFEISLSQVPGYES